ncbi:dTMP kinase [Pseudoalteromonas spongiae]|uniref:dTMP kinase n=1 Tax=Pseudoalteromonas spongiae TaxID=298657 RepID=UPI00026CC7E5|nr:dTMP kinase [Pseudoalteromonas spongiae]ATC98837.1 dTMP kinase [Pseudoalteromonas spongiae UST010723-006]
MNGKFVVIEGLEGAGKSSAIAVCQRVLHDAQVKFVNTREPGGTPLAESLRSLVKATHEEKVSDATELLLMYAARSQLVENVINPALNRGDWVLGDRHDLSSQAYQGGGREIDKHKLEAFADIVLGELKPDLTLYLDIDPKIGLARAANRGELDRIELEQLSFFERTREVYLNAAKNDSSIVTIDASLPMETVHKHIEKALKQFIDGANA